MTDFPMLRAFAYDISEVSDPAGTRHIYNGHPAFINQIAFECQPSTATSGLLMFEDIKFDTSNLSSHKESKVVAILFNLDPTTTTGSGIFISNIRFYLADNSALLAGKFDTATEPAIIQYAVSGIWQPNAVLPSGITDRVPTSAPTLANVKRQDGFPSLEGSDDGNVSQYIYMNLVVPLGFPLGLFGDCGSGLLRLNTVFDFYTVN